MRQSRLFKPYGPDGKPNYRERGKPGVYLVYKRENENEDWAVVYVGFSEKNLYRTMYRHFQKWSDQKDRPNLTYFGQNLDNFRLRVVRCTGRQAVALESYLIWKIKPVDNFYKLEGLKANNYSEKQFQIMRNTPTEPVSDFKPGGPVDEDLPF
jgi:hypothetical protein